MRDEVLNQQMIFNSQHDSMTASAASFGWRAGRTIADSNLHASALRQKPAMPLTHQTHAGALE